MKNRTALHSLVLRSAATISAGLLISPLAAHAATFNWTCVSGNWADTACWNPAGTPTNTDSVDVPTVSGTNTSLTIDGSTGTASAGTMYLDATAGTYVTLQQNGGLLDTGYEYIGYSGSGANNYVESGGANSASSFLYLAYGSGSNAAYTLSGAASLNAGSETIGNSGTATFTQSDGSNTVASVFIVGENTGSNGTYTFNGGNLSAANEYVGDYGTGSFVQNGGTNAISSYLIVGLYGATNNSYTLSNGVLTAADENIGEFGIGTFNQSGGTNAVSTSLTLGSDSTGAGTYALGGGSLNADYEYVADSGTGTFSQSGGTNTVTSALVVGRAIGGSGTYAVSAGALAAYDEYIGNSGTGNMVQTGGSNTVNLLYVGNAAGSVGSYTQNGGTLNAAYEVIGNNGSGNFTQNAGSHVVTGTMWLAANAGSSGTYDLNGGNLNAGIISVGSNGTFQFNGGLLTVGTFSGSLSNAGGTLAPGGTLIGSTKILGNYLQSGTGFLTVKIGGTGTGQFDTVDVADTAMLNGTLNVDLFNSGSGQFTPTYGESFDILTAAALDNHFSSLNYAPLSNGLRWELLYLINGNTDTVQLTAVPLPASAWLLASGLVFLMGTSRRYRRSPRTL